jgi:hypothetical protein
LVGRKKPGTGKALLIIVNDSARREQPADSPTNIVLCALRPACGNGSSEPVTWTEACRSRLAVATRCMMRLESLTSVPDGRF